MYIFLNLTQGSINDLTKTKYTFLQFVGRLLQVRDPLAGDRVVQRQVCGCDGDACDGFGGKADFRLRQRRRRGNIREEGRAAREDADLSQRRREAAGAVRYNM